MSHDWRRRVKTILNRFENELQNPIAYECACVISCGRRSCSYVSLSGLNQGSCGLNTCPTLGSYEVDQGTGMCVFFRAGVGVCLFLVNGGRELVDAHHMGSCGPRASVGG